MSDIEADNEAVNASLDSDDYSGGDDFEDGEGGGFAAKKIVLFVIAPLFLIALIGGGLYFTGVLDKFTGGKEKTESHSSEKSGGGHGDKSAHSADAHFLEIPDIMVNISSSDGQPRYLRLRVQLELKSDSDKVGVEAVMPRVVDQFQTYLRELRVKDLRGSQGIYRLQMELLSRVNVAAYPVEVQDVLFQEILIQ